MPWEREYGQGYDGCLLVRNRVGWEDMQLQHCCIPAGVTIIVVVVTVVWEGVFAVEMNGWVLFTWWCVIVVMVFIRLFAHRRHEGSHSIRRIRAWLDDKIDVVAVVVSGCLHRRGGRGVGMGWVVTVLVD